MKFSFGRKGEAATTSASQPLPLPSVEGDLLPNIGFKNNIFRCSADNGEIVAKKVGQRCELLESEVRMLDYGTRQVHVKGPRLRDVFLNGDERVMVTDFDPGVQLETVWKKIGNANKKLIIQQLRAEVLKMRASTKPLIGRVGWDGEIDKVDAYFDPYHPDTRSHTVTYFATEADFDAYKVEQWRLTAGDAAAKRLNDLIEPLREHYSERFVLTHGDLHSENIHVRRVTNSKGKAVWELSGILDWGSSGFYPEYMEYAVAMKSGPYRRYWQKVMKEVLKGMECSKGRIKVEELATLWAV